MGWFDKPCLNGSFLRSEFLWVIKEESNNGLEFANQLFRLNILSQEFNSAAGMGFNPIGFAIQG